MAPLFAGSSDERSRRRRWTDRIIGILLGLVVGLGVLVYFVFVHSEGTIDAPKVNEGGAQAGNGAQPGNGGQPGNGAQAGNRAQAGTGGNAGNGATGARPEPTGPGAGEETSPPTGAGGAKPIPVVRVIGGAPPTDSGPKQLAFDKGERVRFEIETDEPFSFEIRGLDIKRSIEKSSIISFEATKAGQFPVIATATRIGVADLLIKPAG